jgi:hypothetical protein
VTRSSAEAKRVIARWRGSPHPRGTCGTYTMLQSRNVIAVFESCDFFAQAPHEAPAPAGATVAAVMAGMAG